MKLSFFYALTFLFVPGIVQKEETAGVIRFKIIVLTTQSKISPGNGKIAQAIIKSRIFFFFF